MQRLLCLIYKARRYTCMEKTNLYMMYINKVFENLRMVKFQKLRKGVTVRPEEIHKEL